MSVTDNALRKTAVPFVASPFCYAIGVAIYEDMIQMMDGTTPLATSALRTVRLCKPDKGNLTQAYLNLFMTVNTALTAKVAIGRFDTDGRTVIVPQQVDIDKGHLLLTGTDTPISSVGSSFVIDGLNLLPQIPKKGDADYNADAFVLIVQFSRNLTTSDSTQRQEVTCSMEMGLR